MMENFENSNDLETELDEVDDDEIDIFGEVDPDIEDDDEIDTDNFDDVDDF